MIGKIVGIEEVYNCEIPSMGIHGDMDGYKIQTDKNDFYILIQNEQHCCGDWGYFLCKDNLQDFVGSELTGIKLVYVCDENDKIDDMSCEDKGGVRFVDFITNSGILQLAVYDAHDNCCVQDILVLKDKDILFKDIL